MMGDIQLQKEEVNVELAAHKLSVYEALYHGNGIKGILATAEQYFNHPVFVCDVSYNILASSPLSKDMPYGIRQTKERIYLDTIEIESMKRYKLIEKIYSHNTAFFSTTPDHPENTWVFCAIRIHNIVTGYVAICYDEVAPTEDDLSLTTVTAQVISLEMQKHDFFVSKTGLQYEYFLTDLLEGQFEDLDSVHSRLQLLDRKLYKYLCIMTLSRSETMEYNMFNKKQMEQLRSIYSDSMSLTFKGNIVLLISQNKPIQFNDEKQLALLALLQRNNVKAGISQIFTNPLDAGVYYRQSARTLEIGRLTKKDQSIFHASEMVLQNLLHNYDREELKAFIPYQIGELQQYDSSYNTELVETLKAYLKQNRNATDTAKYLHIHRSTLFYRIKKIEDLLTISINDSKLMFLYELSFAIERYISKTT